MIYIMLKSMENAFTDIDGLVTKKRNMT